MGEKERALRRHGWREFREAETKFIDNDVLNSVFRSPHYWYCHSAKNGGAGSGKEGFGERRRERDKENYSGKTTGLIRERLFLTS